MNTSSEIYRYLESIKLRLESGLTVNQPININEKDINLSRTIEVSKNHLNNYIDEYILYCDFIKDDDLNRILKIVTIISTLLDDFENTPVNDSQAKLRLIGQILDNISRLESITNFNFYNNRRISLRSILNLINLVSQKIEVFKDLNIKNILDNANTSELEEIVSTFIKIHNGGSNYDYLARDVVNAQKVFQLIIDRIRKLEVTETIEVLEEKAVDIKEKYGLYSNENLIEAFKKEGNLHVKEISDYNKLILTLFSIILFTLATLAILSLTTNIFNEIKKIQFYGFYISLFLFITALLTYLIRERKRLLNHQHYCTISHLELLALAPYVAQIDDKSKQDDLIVLLGDRYFKGPNPSTSNDEGPNNITSSKLSEVIKLVQEVKSTIK